MINLKSNQLKKCFILFSLLAYTCCGAQQALVVPGFNYGVKGGLAVSSFGSTQPHLNAKPGFFLGGIVEYSFSDLFSVTAEPGYFQYGGNLTRLEDPSRSAIIEPDLPAPIPSEIYPTPEIPGSAGNKFAPISNTSAAITVHSADLPILGKIGVNLENIRLFISGGGSVSYQVAATQNYDRSYYFNQTYLTVNGYSDITDQFESFQAGLLGGLGAVMNVGMSRRVLMEAQYRRGLTPIKRSFSYQELASVQGDLYGDSFTLGLGFIF